MAFRKSPPQLSVEHEEIEIACLAGDASHPAPGMVNFCGNNRPVPFPRYVQPREEMTLAERFLRLCGFLVYLILYTGADVLNCLSRAVQ